MFFTELATCCPEWAWFAGQGGGPTPYLRCPLEPGGPLGGWWNVCNYLARLGFSPGFNFLIPPTDIAYGGGLFCISHTGEYFIPHIINNLRSCHGVWEGACVWNLSCNNLLHKGR